MDWQGFVLINALFIALSMIIMRLLGRDKAYTGASFVINAGSFVVLWLSGVALLPLLGTVDGQMLHQYFWRFVGGGVLFALTNVATYKSLTYVDAATGTIFNTINTLFSVGMAALTLHEDLSVLQAGGAVVLMVAIIYSALTLRANDTKFSRRDLLRGLEFALLAALVYAVAITNEKWLLGQMNAASYVAYGWGWQVVASVVAALLLQPKKLKLLGQLSFAGWLAALGVVKGVAGIAFVLAEIRSNNVALVTVVNNFKIIIVVVLGAWLLKERRKLRQKAIGAVAALAGLTVMFWH